MATTRARCAPTCISTRRADRARRTRSASRASRTSSVTPSGSHRCTRSGTQALLLAGIAGVTGTTGIVILLAFVVGLLLSNTLVAVVSASGFIGAQRMRTLYVVVGAFAGAASLVIGALFIVGLGTALPDLQQVLFGGQG